MIAKVNYLKRLIAFEGLSLKDFASEIEANSNFLNSIVNGKRTTSPKTANKIAKRLNVDIKDIFIFIEEKEEVK
ncbi:TPA: helix-turn-helix transcriptional regulator [Staphylococcus aureus]|nr:helix-turn-helix domain-containing protein [Staphylococcus aureus]